MAVKYGNQKGGSKPQVPIQKANIHNTNPDDYAYAQAAGKHSVPAKTGNEATYGKVKKK